MKPVRLDESFGLPQVILTRSLCFVLRSLQARDVTYNVGLPSQKNILMEHVILIFLHKAAQLKHFFSYSGQRWMRDIYFIIQWKGHTHSEILHSEYDLYPPFTMRLSSFGRGLRSLWMEHVYWPSSVISTLCIWRLYSCLSPTLDTMDTRGSTDHLSFPANMMLERFSQAPFEIPSNR